MRFTNSTSLGEQVKSANSVFWFKHVGPYTDYKVEEDEVGGTCGTNGGEEERV
jgi:hypothetical protein